MQLGHADCVACPVPELAEVRPAQAPAFRPDEDEPGRAGGGELLSNRPVLQRAVKMRDPYVDALSLLQLRALRVLRSDDAAASPEWQRLLLLSVSGVAAGLQNTG